MLYTADVDIEQSVNPSLMATPDDDRLDCASGLLENHDYEKICDVSIDEAITTITNEAELLARIASIPEEEQENALEEIYDELFDDCDPLIGLDFGVAGLVEALAAIGCATISSCNGGVMGDSHALPHPSIIFYAPTNLVDLLLRAAIEVNVGLVNTDSGMLEIYSDDIRKFNQLADQLTKLYERPIPD